MEIVTTAAIYIKRKVFTMPIYTNTEKDSGIQSDLNGIMTDLFARMQ